MMNMNTTTTHEIKRNIIPTTYGPMLELQHTIHSEYGYASLAVSVVPTSAGCYEVSVENFLLTYGGGIKNSFGGRRLSLSRSCRVYVATLVEAVRVAYKRFYKRVEMGTREDFPELDVTAVK